MGPALCKTEKSKSSVPAFNMDSGKHDTYVPGVVKSHLNGSPFPELAYLELVLACLACPHPTPKLILSSLI